MFAQHPDVYAKLYQPFQFDDDRLPSAPVFATQLVTAVPQESGILLATASLSSIGGFSLTSPALRSPHASYPPPRVI